MSWDFNNSNNRQLMLILLCHFSALYVYGQKVSRHLSTRLAIALCSLQPCNWFFSLVSMERIDLCFSIQDSM